MALASLNISIAIYGNRVISLRKKLDRLLVYKNRRYATFKQVNYFRYDNIHSSVKNESFVYMAEKDLVDCYSFPQEYNYENEHLEKSKVLGFGSYQLGQLLTKSNYLDKTDLSTFFINSKKILAILLIGYLFTILSSLIITKLINYFKNANLKIKLKNLLYLDFNRSKLSFELSYIRLFFYIFAFLNLTILRNNIKTDNVIIRTDDFLNSNDKILKTVKKFLFRETEKDVFANAPFRSFLSKLYNKKVNLEKNYFSIPAKKTANTKSEIGRRNSLLFDFGYLSSLYTKNEFLYLDDKNYFENLHSIYIRKSLDSKMKKQIHSRISNYIEAGFYQEMYSKVEEEYLNFLKVKIKIYFNLKDFIDNSIADHSLSASSLLFFNFKNIFIYFILNLIFIFLIFICHLNYIIIRIFIKMSILYPFIYLNELIRFIFYQESIYYKN